jgi:dUTP pyrophosphatase
MSEIKFVRTRTVKLPERGHPTSAGIDFFVPKFDKEFVDDFIEKNPLLYDTDGTSIDWNNGTLSGTTLSIQSGVHTTTNTPKYELDLTDDNDSLIKFDEDKGKAYIPLAPGARVLIPSGIYTQMQNEGRALIAFNKSGVATREGMDLLASVVDYEYQGEIHLSLKNDSTKVVRIYEDAKILQFIEMPIFTSDIKEEKDLKTLYPTKTKRGEGGFSSTGK